LTNTTNRFLPQTPTGRAGGALTYRGAVDESSEVFDVHDRDLRVRDAMFEFLMAIGVRAL